MYRRTTLLAAFLSSAFLSGCMATKVDLVKFRDADLKEAEILPSKNQLNHQRTKIVVFEADERAVPAARGTHLGLALSNAVEKALTASGAEIVDRSMAEKLGNELMLAESKGSGSYDGPEVAQFAIRGKVTAADYGAKYNEASSYTDKKGKTHYSPASYDHRADVGGSVSIYELPSLRLVSTLNVSGKATASDPRQGPNAATGASLLRSAAESAIEDSAHELKNLFAPKGYVVERRTNGEDSIFKILIGRAQGVKAEDKVVIYSLRKKVNALTGVEQMEELPVVEAKVSEQVAEGDAWIVPADKEAATRIRLGDFVKIKYAKKSLMDNLMNF